jgi:hypothetical protein
MLIAQANAELKVLRSHSQAKTYNFETTQFASSFTVPSQPTSTNTEELLSSRE